MSTVGSILTNVHQNGSVIDSRGSLIADGPLPQKVSAMICSPRLRNPSSSGSTSQPSSCRGGSSHSASNCRRGASLSGVTSRFSKYPFGLSGRVGRKWSAGPRSTPKRSIMLAASDVPLRCIPTIHPNLICPVTCISEADHSQRNSCAPGRRRRARAVAAVTANGSRTGSVSAGS